MLDFGGTSCIVSLTQEYKTMNHFAIPEDTREKILQLYLGKINLLSAAFAKDLEDTARKNGLMAKDIEGDTMLLTKTSMEQILYLALTDGLTLGMDMSGDLYEVALQAHKDAIERN